MRKLTTIASTLTLAATASAQPDRPAAETPETPTDPLYRIEVVLFAFDEGNRGEEDFLHGIENPNFEPPPRLLRLPAIELESVFNLGPSVAASDLGILVEIDPQTERPAEQAPEPIDATSPFDEPVEAIDQPLDAASARTASDDQPLDDRLELFETQEHTASPQSAADHSVPAGFRPLRRDELELTAVAARMDRRPYTLLGYAGWEQAGVDTDRSVELDLKRVGIDNPAGTIELYLRRFLHVRVDLEFFDGSGTFWTLPPAFGLTPLRYAQSFKVVHERNAIRSGELHHIDHPLFGVLLQITPAPEPEDEEGSASGNRPAG
jgi:hypothetical protein